MEIEAEFMKLVQLRVEKIGTLNPLPCMRLNIFFHPIKANYQMLKCWECKEYLLNEGVCDPL